MNIGAISLRRTYLIARRDYIGYIKTWGFWLSFLFPFIGGAIGFFVASADFDFSQTRYETILDETGEHGAAIIAAHRQQQFDLEAQMLQVLGERFLSAEDADRVRVLHAQGGLDSVRSYLDEKIPGAGRQLKIPQAKTVFIHPPADTLDSLQSYIRDETVITVGEEQIVLDGVLHLYRSGNILAADYWSDNINNQDVKNMARRYFRRKATERYLASGGLDVDGLNAVRDDAIDIGVFDPTKTVTEAGDGQAVTIRDKVPHLTAAILSGFLWLTVFSGAYMLLTSMLEEKLGKLLEMTLVSTRLSEIIMGKLVGVAALTLTSMLPYILIAIGGVAAVALYGDPEVMAGIRDALDTRMLIFFLIYLVLGYVFYGAFFVALGALAESMQDAQTITTPIILVLTLCIMVVPLGLDNPESPWLIFAAWFPLSSPFAALMRLPSDPPLWELLLSVLFLFLSSVVVIWLAGRVFRYGVLSGAGLKGIKHTLTHMFSRKTPS